MVCEACRQAILEGRRQKNPTGKNPIKQKTNFKLVYERKKENMVTHHAQEFRLR